MGNRGDSTGGGGGVGPAGRKTDGNLGTKRDAEKASSRGEFRKFVSEGGVTGAIIKKIAEGNKKAKKKKEANVEVGLGKDRMSNYGEGQGGTRPGGDGENQDTKKSEEQPKVKPQMDNTEVTSDAVTADTTSPTTAEMPDEADTVELSEDEKLIKRKRGRKTKTVLTSVTGDNTKATLSKRTLLGY